MAQSPQPPPLRRSYAFDITLPAVNNTDAMRTELVHSLIRQQQLERENTDLRAATHVARKQLFEQIRLNEELLMQVQTLQLEVTNR